MGQPKCSKAYICRGRSRALPRSRTVTKMKIAHRAAAAGGTIVWCLPQKSPSSNHRPQGTVFGAHTGRSTSEAGTAQSVEGGSLWVAPRPPSDRYRRLPSFQHWIRRACLRALRWLTRWPKDLSARATPEQTNGRQYPSIRNRRIAKAICPTHDRDVRLLTNDRIAIEL